MGMFTEPDRAFETIDLLRLALASIWTELEKDRPHEEIIGHSQQIASEALELTKQYAGPKDLTKDGVGIEGWKQR